MSTDEHTAPISASARACLIAFEKCILNASQSVLDIRRYSEIEDQMARFSIWTSNMAVFSKAKSCMDHRLREAKDVQRIILGMLEILEARTVECDRIISQLPKAPKRIPQASPSQIFNEFGRVTAALSAQVRLFHEVSNAIRKASRESQNFKAAKYFVLRDFEGNNLEHELQRYYTLNLRDRFPESSESICERISASMIMRRKRILYRRDRYLSTPIKPLQPASKPIPALRPTQLPFANTESRPTRIPKVTLNSTASQIHSPTVKTATTLDPKRFKSFSAPSVVSSTQYTDLNDIEDLVFPSPPSAPKDHGSERTCPFCLYVLPDHVFADIERWKKHVLVDLEPLVCLFDTCDSSEALYSHRKDWLRHMRKSSFNDSQKKLLSEKGIQSNSPLFEHCPLCGATEEQDNVADGDMIAHIVNHLRSIALKSLPPLYTDDDEDHAYDENSASRGSRSTIKDFESSLVSNDSSQFIKLELDDAESIESPENSEERVDLLLATEKRDPFFGR
ncbi:hypothetical protein G7054_g7430 [Neopestalotiopsis clavispora]|nr:hypothetical protein G7054_g7430 [Neopestalotiopsis clavispora]